MIIRFPTGFYKTVLPQQPSDSTSVTFTISNTDPPRTELIFPKLPTGVETRQRLEELEFDRTQLGDLIFTVSEAEKSEINNNANLFEVGQIIEFGENSEATVDPMFVAPKTEVRHDTSKFDYSAMGLDEDDIFVLESSSSQRLIILQDQLNVLKQDRANAEQVISEKQKLINDLDRNINAISLLVDDTTNPTDSDIAEVLDKLEAKRQVVIQERDEAVAAANTASAQASIVSDQLRTMSTIVK